LRAKYDQLSAAVPSEDSRAALKDENANLRREVTSLRAKYDQLSAAVPSEDSRAALFANEADAWRTKYKQLAESRSETDVVGRLSKAMEENQGIRLSLERVSKEAVENRARLSSAVEEIKALQKRLADAQAGEKEARTRLASAEEAGKAMQSQLSAAREAERAARLDADNLKSEQPLVRERLQQGAAAIKRMQAVQSEMAALQSSAVSKARQNDLELATLKDKLRAATQDASEKASDTHTCVEMLRRSQQILKTCSTLFAQKEDAQPLASALHDTNETIHNFLQTVEARHARKP
jgi:chromosome segregation ATPase